MSAARLTSRKKENFILNEPDPYRRLGFCSEDVCLSCVKNALAQLLWRWHPDKTRRNTTEVVQRLLEAYHDIAEEVLDHDGIIDLLKMEVDNGNCSMCDQIWCEETILIDMGGDEEDICFYDLLM